jgi:muramoyltetrapeptide carboxypeptidase
LHACAASGRLLIPEGAIVALEDVGEASYRVDRALTTLIDAGHFKRAAGIVVGEFTDCPAGTHGVSVQEVLRERLSGLGVPVLSGLGFGHGRHNRPLVLGLDARIDGANGSLELGLSAS